MKELHKVMPSDNENILVACNYQHIRSGAHKMFLIYVFGVVPVRFLKTLKK